MPARSKFTKVAREKILEVKKVGGPDTLACAVAGITDETLRRWLAKGRENGSGAYHDFARAYEIAKAAPQVRALVLLQDKLEDSDNLLMKYIERQIEGYSPPQPAVQQQPAPTVIHLTLGGSARPMPAWIEGEIVDAEEVPALSDGGDIADPDAGGEG